MPNPSRRRRLLVAILFMAGSTCFFVGTLINLMLELQQ